jgi:hypothetical protein
MSARAGGSRNFSKFIDLFDGVFVLEVDLDTLNRRIDERCRADPDDWGGEPSERALIVRLHQTKEDTPGKRYYNRCHPPLARVVDEILRQSEANKPSLFRQLLAQRGVKR